VTEGRIDRQTALRIVELVAAGKSFRAIGRISGLPSQPTITRFYSENGDFKLLVDNARRTRSAMRASDTPTLERQNRGDVVFEVIDRTLAGEVIQTRARGTMTTRLDWYLARKVITEDMHRAGEKMAAILFRAGKMPRVCVMFRERVSGLGVDDPHLTKTDAQIALNKALAVLNAQETDAIWDVCALDNWANNSKHLITGLRALTVHFMIKAF